MGDALRRCPNAHRPGCPTQTLAGNPPQEPKIPMTTPTQILFGGSYEINGDYTFIHKRAKAGLTTEWEAMKHTRKGDWVRT